jgi:hypothetical protein
MKKYLLPIFLFSTQLVAQQLPQLSNFMQNQIVLNPAATGMNESELNASILSRLQWSGIKGAPTSNMFWAGATDRDINIYGNLIVDQRLLHSAEKKIFAYN